MNPLVSVIIPVYHQEKYLHETIESVLSQTFQDYEFILIDDGSKDNSAQIIAEYAKKDKRIVPIYQSNSGKPNTLNAGAIKARGKYIAFMDHDDLMLPERLERQSRFLSSNLDVNAVSCHCLYINHRGESQGLQRFPSLSSVAECRIAATNKYIINCAFTGFMIEKQIFTKVGGLKNQFWPCDDLDFFNRLIDQNYVLVVMPEVLMKYRVHDSATSVSKQSSMFQMGHYTNHCIYLRRNGFPEISFEDYLAYKKKEPWWKRLRVLQQDYGMLYHRTAGRALLSKNYVSFLGLFALATILSPKFVYHTILNKVKK